MSYALFNGLWITEHRKSGKMDGKDSIMLSHPYFCKNRTSGICAKCYSKRISGYRPCLATRQDQNTNVLKNNKFMPCKLHTVDSTLRWSSTGEISNDQMFRNICSMVDHNDHIYHQIWTKQAGILKRNQDIIPYNLTIVWSATKINVKKPFIPDFADIGFFVYSSEDKIPGNITHRCKGKCKDCGFCYKIDSKGIVAEVLK